LFTLEEAPGAGRGVFASRDLTPGEKDLTANDLAVHVLFREYHGEICYNCFGYDLGGKQPIRDVQHGLAFCTDKCQIEFLLEEDDLCMAARAAVEK
jgi:SET and MYND domain-containing protein